MDYHDTILFVYSNGDIPLYGRNRDRLLRADDVLNYVEFEEAIAKLPALLPPSQPAREQPQGPDSDKYE